MKKLLVFITILTGSTFFYSCSKDDDSQTANSRNVRFEFTADAPAAYGLHAGTADGSYDETINGTSWSKTVAVTTSKPDSQRVASLIVTAPDSWMGTSNSANVSLKIFVDDKERA